MQLAWLGVPECKNEVGRLICLCLESLCNGFLPSKTETSPEGGDLQALAMFFLVLVLLVMLVVAICSLQKLARKHTMKDRDDVEGGEDNTANSYMQRSELHLSPYYNFPSSPPQCSGSPAPLLRMCSAPARLPSSKQLGEITKGFAGRKFAINNSVPQSAVTSKPIIKVGGPISKYLDITNVKSYTKVVKKIDIGEERADNLAYTSEEVIKVPIKVKHTGKVTAV